MEKIDSINIETLITERLENGESKDDIILYLCENTAMSWPEAETLLKKVHNEKRHHIVLAQSPLLILIALTIFVGGIGLVTFSAYNIAENFLYYYDAKNGSVGLIGMILYVAAYGGYLWFLAFLGLGMIIGSLKGMEEVWSALFKKLGILQ